METCFGLLRKGAGYEYSTKMSNPIEISRMITHLVRNGLFLVVVKLCLKNILSLKRNDTWKIFEIIL